MGETDRYRMPSPDLLKRIQDLEARLSTIERVPQIGNTTLDRGAFQVKDDTGSVRVRVGLLSDGSYGMEVRETGQENFHQVPYVFAQQIMPLEPCSSATYVDLSTFGPSVTVPVRSSGRILIIATCQIHNDGAFANDSFSNARAAVAMSGANTASADDVSPLLVYRYHEVILGAGNVVYAHYGTDTAQAVVEGLAPGSTTITMKYRKGNQVGAPTVNFARRTLTVVTL